MIGWWLSCWWLIFNPTCYIYSHCSLEVNISMNVGTNLNMIFLTSQWRENIIVELAICHDHRLQVWSNHQLYTYIISYIYHTIDMRGYYIYTHNFYSLLSNFHLFSIYITRYFKKKFEVEYKCRHVLLFIDLNF